ncbi:MFS transporter [Rubrobacter indicoceani]|uniref:MFS transporter n=1 Tax=Rubrobacter indicoceani TaxID=2051957 RepID=UPI0013C4D593|nr:MFS transporter [Rubrobacter indicoceani]
MPDSASFRSILLAFVGLGFHVGVWAVLVADLAGSADLTPGMLGVALSVMTFAGIVALFLSGALSDRFGRLPFLLIGAGGTGAFFLTLAIFAGSGGFVHLLVLLGVGGVCASAWDLAVNALGSDYESEYRVRVMTFLHAGFSASAAVGALSSGMFLWASLDFRALYAFVGLGLISLAMVLSRSRFPGNASETTGDYGTDTAGIGTSSLLLMPAVLGCVAIVFMSFSTDAILEGFLSVYLRDALASGPLLGGVALASLYSAAALGRLLSGRLLGIFGEKRTLATCGAGSAVGMLCVVATTSGTFSAAALLLVGFATAPVAPVVFSLAARAVPGASGRIISLVTIFGYAAFTLGPLVVGFVSDLTSVRTALLFPVAMSLGLMFVALFFLPGEPEAFRNGRDGTGREAGPERP